MLRVSILFLCLCLSLGSAGCTTFSVRTADAKRTPYKSETVHAYLWNMTKLEPVLIADCGGRGLMKVRAKTNYLYWLVGVFTFGGWVPMGLEYRCGPEA